MRKSAINSLIGETTIGKKEIKKEAEEEEEKAEIVVPDHQRNHISNGSRGIKRSPTQSDEIDTSKYLEMELYTNCGSIETSPLPSPLTPAEHQDMFCSSTMSGDCSSNTSIEGAEGHKVVGQSETSSSSSPKRLCLVCGDVASGFHYGVASCEACKAFFKRTIQGNIEYQCPATNDCEINKRRRKACQACRFQKCLRMGMLKEGVRLDRVRGGRQKYRRTPENSNSFPVQTHTISASAKASSLEGNKIVSALLNCEPEPLVLAVGSHGSQTSSPQNRSVSILSDLVDKELVATISWAKQIPGFTDLILNDQMRLLQTTWGEILALSLAFRSQQHLGSSQLAHKLLFASDFVMDEQQAIQCRAEEMFTLSIQLVKRLSSLRLAKEEYLVLKALLLTNVDIPLEDSAAVNKLRESIVCSLQDCVSSIRSYNCNLHLAQMLLCLPILRQTDAAIRRYWINVRRDGKIAMNKLFVEMLESNVSLR